MATILLKTIEIDQETLVIVSNNVAHLCGTQCVRLTLLNGDYSARQKIDIDLIRLDVQIRLHDGKSVTDSAPSSEDAASSDSCPTAPMVSNSVKCVLYFCQNYVIS